MVLTAIAESRVDLTRIIVLALTVERLWQIYAIPQLALGRDIWLFYVRCAGLFIHWCYGWYYHGLLVSQASHKGKNAVWDDVIGVPVGKHHRGWAHPAHAVGTS